ncbi:response regulator transcription factor [Edaphobacter aggregans]|uniref:response regulator transcription factor n=1 Tax=Edaphobacter aggregans TaxID=570835 RepID=UPI0005581ADB|nr:response regulator [Edaphobacter aggregans]
MTSTPSLVFIIDDDAGVRTAMQRLLRSVGLNAEAFAAPQEFLRHKRPDVSSCLILDVRLPEISGLEVQRKLIEAGIHIPIIFVTGHADVPMSVKAMKSGAVEFLTKPFRDQDLLDAIQQALERDRRARQEQSEMAELQRRYEHLTPRERQVMRLVASGMSTKEVASLLGTSEVTAKVHRSQMMHKMQADSLVELGRMAEKLKVPDKK